jgi:predicted ATP-dependent serine protease
MRLHIAGGSLCGFPSGVTEFDAGAWWQVLSPVRIEVIGGDPGIGKSTLLLQVADCACVLP